MSDLLPINATSQERAISDVVARVGDVPVPIRDIWNPDTCPSELLAWLAWAFSVDEWDNGWTEAQKREFIKRSVEVHRYKGTIGAVREALDALQFEAQVQEWFAQSPAGDPYTFRVLLTAEQVGIPQDQFAAVFAIIDHTKNLRSRLSEIELTVRSVAGPYLAVAAGVGSEFSLTGYLKPAILLNETTICI